MLSKVLKDKCGRPLTIEVLKEMWDYSKGCAAFVRGTPDPLGNKAANLYYAALREAEDNGVSFEDLDALVVVMPTWTVLDEITHRLSGVRVVQFVSDLVVFFIEDPDYSAILLYG